MKYSIKKIAISLLVLFAFNACTNNFEEINKNPNTPTASEANPALLMPKILFEVGNMLTSGEAWGFGNIVAQLVATNNFTGNDIYNWGTNEGTWNTLYRNIRDANNLILLGEQQANSAYQGAGIVLRSIMLANLTEMWGDVPYSEGLQGKNDIFTPKYDSQADIYKIILSDLASAAELLKKGGSMSGDIMYNGNVKKWEQLANALRMRYLMRTERKWSELGINGPSELQRLVNTNVLLKGNSDNGAIPYIESTNRWPLNTSRVGSFDEKRMSKRMEETLKPMNDPRMFVLFREVDNPESSEFIGVPNGLSEDNASNFNGGARNQSRLGTRFREEPAAVEMMFMHYAEQMFLMAEAVQKGYVTGTANEFYQNGIKSNFQYYGLEASSEYLNQDLVALGTNRNQNLSKIATQKWLAFFMVGNEAWYDFKRTGLPALKPGPNALFDSVPVRLQYPITEQVLNAPNYKAAIAQQGPDEIITPTWLLK